MSDIKEEEKETLKHIECGNCYHVFSEDDAEELTLDNGWIASDYIICPNCNGYITKDPFASELTLSDGHQQIHDESIVSGSTLLTEEQVKEWNEPEQERKR